MHQTVNKNKAIVGCTDSSSNIYGFRWLHCAPNQTAAMRDPFYFEISEFSAVTTLSLKWSALPIATDIVSSGTTRYLPGNKDTPTGTAATTSSSSSPAFPHGTPQRVSPVLVTKSVVSITGSSLVAAPPGVWHYGVSARTGQPGVSIL